IAFFVKRGGKRKSDAVVYHADLWGRREAKYGWLDTHTLKNTKWSKLKPSSPSYLFVPRDNALEALYQRFPSVPGIFPVNSVGIVTARDKLTIGWSAEEIWQRVRVFSQMDPELAREGYKLGKDAQDWKISLSQKDLLDSGPTRSKVVPVLYRPFDVRSTYHTGRARGFICRPRSEVMGHMLAGENLALIMPKRVEHVGTWQHAFVTDVISEHVTVSLKTIDYHFPLHLYPTIGPDTLFAHLEPAERQPNLAPELIQALAAAYGREPGPEEIFHYIYAVLYAPAYREKYAEFLRMDFPRIPFTSDGALFLKTARLGERLTGLHLLTSSQLDPPICRFEGRGDNRVGKGKKEGMRYDPAEQRVYINTTQHFGPVADAVWTYRIGGYQVCEKWLKDRRERRLDLDDIRTYCRIVTALERTMDIQEEINLLYREIEKETLPMTGVSKA
ncbi:MAG: DNA methyltransferase, partial [Deltaproteobacteria bacterium]|nr:DNA methyltransferase [Deltaproteobacteria bacterium]